MKPIVKDAALSLAFSGTLAMGLALIWLPSPEAPVGPQFIPNFADSAIEIPGGSGVVVAEGYVLTAKHVVASWRGEQGFEVDFALDHPTLDVSLVKWPTDGKTVAQFAPGWTFVGQEVSLVGFLMRRSEVHTHGHTGFLRQEDGVSVHSCPSGPGTSGSGMFDEYGRLVGIHTGAFFMPTSAGWEISQAEHRFVELAAFREWLDAGLSL